MYTTTITVLVFCVFFLLLSRSFYILFVCLLLCIFDQNSPRSLSLYFFLIFFVLFVLLSNHIDMFESFCTQILYQTRIVQFALSFFLLRHCCCFGILFLLCIIPHSFGVGCFHSSPEKRSLWPTNERTKLLFMNVYCLNKFYLAFFRSYSPLSFSLSLRHSMLLLFTDVVFCFRSKLFGSLLFRRFFPNSKIDVKNRHNNKWKEN